ncbi:hypothetical protein CHS0354_019215 [Potamilus streckersoni]|uniref:protein acetyllysine N-acetyltransferase n=1 Tax=Potamilus streckersoni TaxID=2493646 RepID=A0AAE0SZ71_9BIVA|nr:hypothetical protein CHS0354_019215 [Potamilus streckersoni]
MAACCCLSTCKEGAITSTHAHVKVRAFNLTENERKDLKAAWSEEGNAVFHYHCWKYLTSASRGKNPDMKLSDLEVQLVQEAAKTAEYHDEEEKVKDEAKRIAQMIRSADYCIGFTGAGISTAAGIGDFRGIDGKWTERDKKKEYGEKGVKKSAKKSYGSYRPTYTHEALVKLMEMGHIKHLISQNTDGLHRLSGFPHSKLSELHGNSFIEKCEKCGAQYERPFSYRSVSGNSSVPPKCCKRCKINHRTGRMCEKKECNGYLMNTIINFGDYLEDEVLSGATQNAKKADLVLCLGTTLQVTPASDLVQMGKKPIKLILCNRQSTPYDALCYEKEKGQLAPNGVRIFGDCDRLMKEVMLNMLGIENLVEWEQGREERMKQYDERRK